MRWMRSGLPLVLMRTLPRAGQAQTVSAGKLSQALGTPGLQAQQAPQFRAEQVSFPKDKKPTLR